MMKAIFPIAVLSFFSLTAFSQPAGPTQPEAGPGGQAYLHEEVIFQDFAAGADGYWLFEPAAPKPDSADVIVFLHGFGAIDPMIYGQWIKHLVRQGNIVIYPRYQKNIWSPSSKKFADNAARAINAALERLEGGGHVCPITSHFSLVGHSYGGAISANLAARYEEVRIPKPKAVMLCAPGTGPLKGGLLDSYEDIPEETRLLAIVHEGDKIVGDKLGVLVFETAVNTPWRNLIRQYEDDHGEPEIYDGHNHAYALDSLFDAGIHNVSYRRALKSAKTDAMDYYGYWKLFDALRSCALSGDDCEYALGDTPEQRYLGEWSDGTAIRELTVIMPETEEKMAVVGDGD